MALAQHPVGGLAGDGERFDEQIVEIGPVCQALAELRRLAAQLVVAERLHVALERVDLRDDALQRFELLAFTGAEDAIEDSHATDHATGATRTGPGVRGGSVGCHAAVAAALRRNGSTVAPRRSGVAATATSRATAPRSWSAAAAAPSVEPVVTTSSTTSTRTPSSPGRATKVGAGETLHASAARLRGRSVSIEQATARHAELASDGAREHLALVEPTLAPPLRARRGPGDDVDVVMHPEVEQPVDDQSGQVATHRPSVAVLPPEHDAHGRAP